MSGRQSESRRIDRKGRASPAGRGASAFVPFKSGHCGEAGIPNFNVLGSLQAYQAKKTEKSLMPKSFRT